jgi:hypothetical protein
MSEQKETTAALALNTTGEIGLYSSADFEHTMRVAKMLSSSNMVPKEYQGSIANTMIATDMAYRMKANVLMIMQNLHIIHGRPSWSSKFLLACLNQCGKFTSIRYKMEGKGESASCMAYTTEIATGEVLEGTTITYAMAKAEGWVDKSGSKWKTMPELMLKYRAVSFFANQYAPELTMGLPTEDETRDTVEAEVIEQPKTVKGVEGLQGILK